VLVSVQENKNINCLLILEHIKVFNQSEIDCIELQISNWEKQLKIKLGSLERS